MKTGSGSHVIVRNPRVRGTRVPVRSIVIAFERYGGDVARVGTSFTLEPEQVRAALAYYEAHKAEIEEILEQREEAAQA